MSGLSNCVGHCTYHNIIRGSEFSLCCSGHLFGFLLKFTTHLHIHAIKVNDIIVQAAIFISNPIDAFYSMHLNGQVSGIY